MGGILILEAPTPEEPIEPCLNQKTLCFKRSQRLLSTSDYKNVFDQNHFRASHKNMLILARANKKHCARLGLIFSKKVVARSVDRNRLKRISREQFRLHNKELAGLDIVIMARNGLVNLPNNACIKLILDLMENIKQQFLQKQKK